MDAPRDLPPRVEQVSGLRLQLVASAPDRRLFYRLLADEHPQGAVRHVGCQLRYLLLSDHGVLGAIGFASTALQLADRDRWIGWDHATRRRRLQDVAGLARFLIRPAAACRNLGSKALALCLQRLPADFRQRYGFEPLLLETFVDGEHHDGTCFKAANWTLVGHTAGCGRFAPAGPPAVSRKAIFVRRLRPDWRERLGVPDPRVPEPLAVTAGLHRDAWAAREFGAARLGDVRWTRRLVQCAAVQADAPRASFPSAAESDRPLVRSWYRFLDRPPDAAIRADSILEPHRERTLQRMRGERAVLCVQDGTDFSFAEHRGCQGLGYISQNKGSRGTRGLHLHSMLAVSEEGLPLGLLRMEFDAPRADEVERDDQRDATAAQGVPAESDAAAESESEPETAAGPEASEEPSKTQRWARGMRDCAELAARLPTTRVITVMDREGDVFELFHERRRLAGVELLVRAKHNRLLAKGRPKLFDHARAAPAQARLQIEVTRSSARVRTRNQEASRLRAARTAQATLRWQAVSLPAPADGPFRGQPAADLWLVHVAEEPAPPAGKPLEWLLLTSVPVRTRQQAERVLHWYRLRWRIEDWHRVLKTGCRAKAVAHRRRERMERALAVKAVIAWRLHLMTLLGRDTPELRADTLFTAIEVALLEHFAKERRLAAPTNLGRAMNTLARMGGWMGYGRKAYAAPGAAVLWEGYARLAARAQALETAIRLKENSSVLRFLCPEP